MTENEVGAKIPINEKGEMVKYVENMREGERERKKREDASR